jgi:tuberous sclerosis protein 2
MSRSEAESLKLRPRANTSFASSFPWTRKPSALTPSHPLAPTPLSLDALIAALYPPAVPSLSHARSLANILPNYSPLPRRDILNPILYSLCSAVSPPSVQAAGFDILAAYWENPEASSLNTAERLSYFSLFLGNPTPWGIELWEPRLKAVRTLTKYGAEIVGIEANLIDLLRRWIEGAFEGLLMTPDFSDRGEFAEREHSLDILVKFLEEVLKKTDTITKITDKMASILHFYASLVDRSICVQDIPQETLPAPFLNPPSTAGSSKLSITRRNKSSLSSSSPPSATSPTRGFPPSITASEYAIMFYLRHVNLHIKSVSHTHLGHILPVLFRALASCSASLPRLSVVMQSPKKNTLEEKLLEVLNLLFAGPYATNCMLILRQHLFPQYIEPHASEFRKQGSVCQPSRIPILTSLGAHRTLRHHVRRALYARIARTWISRDVSYGYSPSGAPGHIELQKEWMEQAWPKEDFGPSSVGVGGNGWDAARMGKALADSVGIWIAYQFPDFDTFKTEEERSVELENVRQGREDILEEAAGILKDILQELDTRRDEKAELDEDEARVIGLTLFKLSDYILPMKCVPKAFHLHQPDPNWITGTWKALPL